MEHLAHFQKILETALDQDGPVEAIWIVENETARVRGNIRTVNEIYKVSDQIISADHINAALKMSADDLMQLNRMIVCASNMQPEEWVLIITILSSYYCSYIFASRRGFAVQDKQLASAVELLKECTSDFRDRGFARALASARRHNPNPLPPPL